ncbi:MAG TPA: ring-cleaving dioxygenase [Chlamydiales bacterium]|nr:ring-cleaving dioxygenase [Chlamydiales bacterium]
MKLVTGLHHITCLASSAQKTVDFYAGILGLRLVKKTINFDAPEIYHLYYGNEHGSPGTIMTFFPYPDIPKGRKGNGQLTVTSFSISESAMDYWLKRLDRFHIAYKKPLERFDELVISFEDHDGIGLELVVNHKDKREGFTYGNIPSEFAIKGFYGMTLSEECYDKTAKLLTDEMDHTLLTEHGNRLRYAAENKPSCFVDIICDPETLKGLGGYGTVHHVAFATANDASQLHARAKLVKYGLDVTPVINRLYFHSIYFREPGGVLFEIATLPPGFTLDEKISHLGESLKLPPWEEEHRELLEKSLPPIRLDLKRFS